MYLSPAIDASYRLTYCLDSDSAISSKHADYSENVEDSEERSQTLDPSELVSSDSRIVLQFWSPDGTFPSKAFQAKFKIESMQFEHPSPYMDLGNPSLAQRNNGELILGNVNYPLPCPSNLRQKSLIRAPSGFNIKIFLPIEESNKNQICESDFVEVSNSGSVVATREDDTNCISFSWSTALEKKELGNYYVSIELSHFASFAPFL